MKQVAVRHTLPILFFADAYQPRSYNSGDIGCSIPFIKTVLTY